MNQTKLPEGWEKRDVDYYVRRDGRCVILDWSSASEDWLCYEPVNDAHRRCLDTAFADPTTAMLALNEKYPLEVKDDGPGIA